MILLTGSSGFVGSNLTKELDKRNINYLPVSRRKDHTNKKKFSSIVNIDENTNWTFALKDCSSVIHTAARVHIMNDPVKDPLTKFRKVNVDGTINLARQCLEEGIKRFIYLSTIKVNGDKTEIGKPFFYNDLTHASDPYAISKFEAEEKLKALCQNSNMDLVIIRPPLVYGPGVKGNFSLLMKAISLNIPLPLKGLDNKRSLISIYNLNDFLIKCLNFEGNLNETFLISDDQDLSTSELISKISFYLKKTDLSFKLPEPLLITLFSFIRKRREILRLTDNLQVDINYSKDRISWSPMYSVEDSLKKMFLGDL